MFFIKTNSNQSISDSQHTMIDNFHNQTPPSTFRVIEAEFVISAPNLKTCPASTFPEIAIAGRSNVGKSSLINMLCNRRNLAKTSNTPGKTQLINFFHLRLEPGSHHFHLIDLPGYGYTRTGKEKQREWGKIISEYLEKRPALVGILHLVDARRDPTELDDMMHQWIVARALPSILVITKCDKISNNALVQAQRRIREQLQLEQDESCIMASVPQRRGTEAICAALVSLLMQASPAPHAAAHPSPHNSRD